MKEIGFSEIHQAVENSAFPDCDIVVGIAEGGIVPAALAAAKKGCDLRIVRFNYRNEENIPQHKEPVALSKINLLADTRTILLVDDVAISGKTMDAAKRLFEDYEVKTLVLRGKADYVLFPNLNRCVKWPWRT